MSNLWAALWVEGLKARHSRVLLFSLAAVSLIPFIGGFFMIVLKDPAMARDLGIISTKAQIVAGEADWPTYLGLLAQAVAIGGIIIFSFVTSWVFGREYVDGTVKDLMALPTPRHTIISAKFVVVALWMFMLVTVVVALGLLVGRLILGPVGATAIIFDGFSVLIVAAALTMAPVTPVALAAVAGHGYLPPMAVAFAAVVAAQIVAAAGWGEYFPWSVPALYAGVAGAAGAQLGPVSFVVVGLTGLFGLVTTVLWFGRADQTR